MRKFSKINESTNSNGPEYSEELINDIFVDFIDGGFKIDSESGYVNKSGLSISKKFTKEAIPYIGISIYSETSEGFSSCSLEFINNLSKCSYRLSKYFPGTVYQCNFYSSKIEIKLLMGKEIENDFFEVEDLVHYFRNEMESDIQIPEFYEFEVLSSIGYNLELKCFAYDLSDQLVYHTHSEVRENVIKTINRLYSINQKDGSNQEELYSLTDSIKDAVSKKLGNKFKISDVSEKEKSAQTRKIVFQNEKGQHLIIDFTVYFEAPIRYKYKKKLIGKDEFRSADIYSLRMYVKFGSKD